MSNPPQRFIAVDWSGAASVPVQRVHIVAADWQAGAITLTNGRTREETIAWLIEQAQATPSLLVGLDFAFSFPAWFVQQQNAATVEEFWRVVAKYGEAWLAACAHPFWGRRISMDGGGVGGRPRPPNHRAPDWLGYRIADRQIAGSIQPKSPFQIGGAGAVGTGSLRGIPFLPELRRAGFAIWPFHAVAWPAVVEIYPRTFTGPVNKSSRTARSAFLDALDGKTFSGETARLAIESEDAFDALCSVLGVARQLCDVGSLRQTEDRTLRLEGSIFSGRCLPGQPLS